MEESKDNKVIVHTNSFLELALAACIGACGALWLFSNNDLENRLNDKITKTESNLMDELYRIPRIDYARGQAYTIDGKQFTCYPK